MPRPGMLPAEYPRHRPAPSTLCPCPVWSCRLWAPLFRRDEATIDKAFIPAQLLLVIQLGQEGSPEFEQKARLLPGFEPAPAGAGTPISPREFAPLGSCPEDPEDALKAAPIVYTRASTAGG